jgi:hypothetical protein
MGGCVMPDNQTISSEPYISNKRSEPIPSCSVDIPYLKQLFNLASEISNKGVEKALASLVKKESVPEEIFEEEKDFARQVLKLKIYIYGRNGEFIVSDSLDIFDQPSFPHYVNKISFDNASPFINKYKVNPLYLLRIDFDFTKPGVFVWPFVPSSPTPNNSSITLEAIDQEWLEWAYNRIKESIATRQKKVYWIHKSHAYDILLWFFYSPILFWNIHKLDIIYSDILSRMSSVFKTALYLYIFLFAIFLFMLLFSYIRWVFPYQEFIGNTKSISAIHKTVILAILSPLLISVIRDVIKYIVPLLF